MYNVCVCKATRPVSVIHKDVADFRSALSLADETFEVIKLLGDFTPTGVSVMIVKSEDLEDFVSSVTEWPKHSKYQCGSY